MAAVLQPTRFSSYANRSPTGGGILLNPSPSHHPFSLPSSSYVARSKHHPSMQSLSSSASSSDDINTPSTSTTTTPPPSMSNSLSLPYSSDDDHAHRSRSGSAPESSATGNRRIRFAPLPDPRRAVLVTEHGEELPLPAVFDDDDPNSIPCPPLLNFSSNATSSLLLGDSVVPPKELPTIIATGPSSSPPQCIRITQSTPSSPARPRPIESPCSSTMTITPTVSAPNTPSFAKKLLRPFRQKSCNDDSQRPGSRDSSRSRDEAPSSWGMPLGRWTSAEVGGRRSSSSSANGAPLARVQSATTTAPKRLLNGRVYGARKPPHYQNAFQNVRDQEPEFVEWGYGGMGSVNAGGAWSKVQSGQKILIGHSDERGRRGAPQPADEDDGSGMGWVRRRREERERKKLEEQTACEAAEKPAASSEPSLAPEPVVAPTPTTAPALAPSLPFVDHTVTTVKPVQPQSDDEDDDEDSEAESKEGADDESSSAELEDDDAAEEQHLKQILGAGVERVSRHRE
ncbi:hypothetical protein BC834DRAFT_846451 [Gloeopeniophorella convolvens]|nr:hypothetical protein BC834DRAFT_846451 [Gloeopeniophorella convolvens]